MRKSGETNRIPNLWWDVDSSYRTIRLISVAPNDRNRTSYSRINWLSIANGGVNDFNDYAKILNHAFESVLKYSNGIEWRIDILCYDTNPVLKAYFRGSFWVIVVNDEPKHRRCSAANMKSLKVAFDEKHRMPNTHTSAIYFMLILFIKMAR